MGLRKREQHGPCVFYLNGMCNIPKNTHPWLCLGKPKTAKCEMRGTHPAGRGSMA